MKHNQTYHFKLSSLLLFIFIISAVPAVNANVFVIFYATHHGKTGHTGIAVDSYDIFVHDSDYSLSVNDTQSTGNLIYFDLWPKSDAFIRGHLKRNLEPSYYKLPRASNEQKITINSLLTKGLPHKEFQAVDGLIEIETKPYQDYKLILFLTHLSESNKAFNAQFYNCTDFVCSGLSILINKKFTAKEFFPFTCFSTPNKLFKKLTTTRAFEISILKHPGKEIEGCFVAQKIIPELKNKIRKKNTEQL